MSLIVLAIGAAHTLPPIIGAAVGKTKASVIIGSVVGILIAFATGNPAFVAADLIGVGVGTWLGYSLVGDANMQ